MKPIILLVLLALGLALVMNCEQNPVNNQETVNPPTFDSTFHRIEIYSYVNAPEVLAICFMYVQPKGWIYINIRHEHSQSWVWKYIDTYQDAITVYKSEFPGPDYDVEWVVCYSQSDTP